MIDELITAFVLGLIGGMIPGPVLTAIFTEILQSSLLRSFRIIFMAMFTETVVALISLLLLASLNLSEAVFRGISFIGAGILIWIANSIWKIKKIDTEERVHFGFWKISAMILANGVLWTFWITVCVPKAIFLGEQMYLGAFIFLAIVEIGWLCSTSIVAFLFSKFRTLLSKPKVVPIIFKVFACTFVYFAIDMTYQSIRFFINQ
ncbi:MAG: LysE family transporter [Candidatus Peribacteraceae bacterium]